MVTKRTTDTQEPPTEKAKRAASPANFKSSADSIKNNIIHNLLTIQGRDPERSGTTDVYKALAYAVRDIMVKKWIATQKSYYKAGEKRVYYLSLEFLIGRTLVSSMINLGIFEAAKEALAELGYDIDRISDEEEDAGLGNGGLGRLAACFMDSIATLKIPAYGYGIRYEYGLFTQRLVDGYQVESPDNWLQYGTPWEFERRMPVFPVQFYGNVITEVDKNGNYRARWVNTQQVMAVPCDMLVPGYDNDHVINMRLWTAKASSELDLNYFGQGDYINAVQSKVSSETISKVLYPPDHNLAGQELRLRQQYFFVAATFQDILRRYRKTDRDFANFPNAVAVQLNDTHPAIAIPELMRILLDIEGLSWEKSWDICVRTFGYTNHTLMPEALEKWSVDLMGRVLPRHLQIIYEINQRFLENVAHEFPGDTGKLRDMSLIEEGEVKKVRMAHLAVVGSHSINGVAALHSELLKTRLFPDFYRMYPERFNNKTNGITPRRWLLQANPQLAELISDKIGDNWITNLDELQRLEPFAEDAAFRTRWREIKQANKERLAAYIHKFLKVEIGPHTLFDVQVKRIHEYKRQLLNVLHVVYLYQQMLQHPERAFAPRTAIFAGKAAPSYWRAKLIIKMINSLGEVINNDPRVNDLLKVVFLPNYTVSQAEIIIPAADLSEQISTAGTEASGTGNMKFALNGALTIGTLDGANIEIREEVGEDNIFIFGMTAEEVAFEKLNPSRTPEGICQANPAIREVMDSIASGAFSRGDKRLFQPLLDTLMSPHDQYLLLLDLESYIACQQRVRELYLDQENWTKKSILNVARMGKFSTDRTIRQYSEEIWGIPCSVTGTCLL